MRTAPKAKSCFLDVSATSLDVLTVRQGMCSTGTTVATGAKTASVKSNKGDGTERIYRGSSTYMLHHGLVPPRRLEPNQTHFCLPGCVAWILQ